MSKTIAIPPPISANLALGMRITGILCLCKPALILVLWFVLWFVSHGLQPVGGLQSSILWEVLLPLITGAYLFVLPTSRKAERAKLLAERDRAAKRGVAILYVEQPADPAMVTMSLWLGSIALMAIPLLFGPAAIATGVVAIAQGHSKGFNGVVLGTITLGALGTVIYFMSHRY
jgi:hypothetical protein